MSKVNVDEIKVGDLVGRYSEALKKTCLGVVTDISGNQVYALWSNDYPTRALWCYSIYLTGHWKVINFEEENKMDELKVYTGKDAIELLLEGKTLECVNPKIKYKIEDNTLYQEGFTGWSISDLQLTDFLNLEFTEVAFPQVGDWVRVTCKNDGFSKVYTAEVKSIDNEGIWGEWNQPLGDIISPILLNDYSDWEILTPEQVSEYKREQVFLKAGRKVDEYRENDIVFLENTGTICMVTTKSNVNGNVGVKEINKPQKWCALVNQLTPISFAENLVSLS